MARCLSLAQLGAGYVAPNPKVGAVIVHNDKIIGEGYHEYFGGNHAEVNAIQSVKDKELLKDSTLYVNLEPCCHWGKTPPCTSLIIQSGIKNLVIGSRDYNPLVAGKGIDVLKKSKITVTTDIMKRECEALNLNFFENFLPNKILDITIKWAESANGFMGKQHYSNIEERELSNSLSKRFVHKLRSEHDAIMVGTNTVLIDNPQLDNRYWFGPSPTVIIIDQNLKIPTNSNVFAKGRKLIIINSQKTKFIKNISYIKVDFKTNDTFWESTSDVLLELGIRSVLIEGGAITIQSFLDFKKHCTIYRIKTPKIWANGILAPKIINPFIDSFTLGDNTIEIYEI